MLKTLHWNTVSPLLSNGLKSLMAEPIFQPFRLVGGTSLSLQIGHRMSIDIDLFTDATYGSVDFSEIDNFLRKNYLYISPAKLPDIIAMGVSYIIGNREDNSFKLDLYYTTESFIFPVLQREKIRMASVEEIAAMKIDVVQRIGRKKDFWDIHALLSDFSIEQMIEMHKQRYQYTHDEATIRTNLTNFSFADQDFEPICLVGKQWEIIKLDIVEALG